MPKLIHKRLTVAGVKSETRSGAYADGNGLYLRVAAGGTKYWALRYVRNRRDRWLTLGPVRLKSLDQARIEAWDLQRSIRQGADPHGERVSARAKLRTFKEIAAEYVDERCKKLSASSRTQWDVTMRLVEPELGALLLPQIELAHVQRVLKPHWDEGKMTSFRNIRTRVEAILDYARVQGLRQGDNPARWKGNLEHVFKSAERREVKHYDALPSGALPMLMQRLAREEDVYARALEFIVFTGARGVEVRLMAWDEVAAATWTRPAAHMKARHEHRVPLSAPALAVLKRTKRLGELVFPGVDGEPMSRGMLDHFLKKMLLEGESATIHGFRSTFASWAKKQGFSKDLRELALAHEERNKTTAAYEREDLFEQRVPLMQAWGSFVMGQQPADNVTPLARKRA